MTMTGSSDVQDTQLSEPKTLIGRFNALRDRYRLHTSIALAVLAALTFIAAEIVPAIQDYILTSGLLQYVTLIVLLDLATSVYLLQRPQATRLARNQDESMPTLLEACPHCRGDGVDLIEYASATTLPLIRAIRREGVPMRLLIQHPENIVGLQKHRSITTLDTIYNSIFDDYQGSFEIRCYKLPYTLRGRRLGKTVLELGWLTPDVKRQTAYGHGNPCIIADLSISSNQHLLVFFERTFETLWNHTETEDGRAVLERLGLP